MKNYDINHLRELEAESIYVIREVAAQFERPALLFSGGPEFQFDHRLRRRQNNPWRPADHVAGGGGVIPQSPLPDSGF